MKIGWGLLLAVLGYAAIVAWAGDGADAVFAARVATQPFMHAA